MIDVIILAGGKGTRMGENVSKPLVLARNKEIIAWQLDNLYRNYSGLIGKVIVAISFRGQDVQTFLSDKYPNKDIKISFEEIPLGTGGAIKQAAALAESRRVIVFNVDDINDVDLNDFCFSEKNRVVVVRPILPFGLIKERDGWAEFVEKPRLEDVWISSGWYFLDRQEIMDKFPYSGSVEYDVFQKGLMQLQVYYHKGFWQPLNSKKELENFSTEELPEKLNF